MLYPRNLSKNARSDVVEQIRSEVVTEGEELQGQ
jgi:hypothetical protein